MFTRQVENAGIKSNVVKECMSEADETMGRAATLFMRLNKTFDFETSDSVKERFLEASREMARTRNANKCTGEVVDQFLNKELLICGDVATTSKILHDRISDKTELFDPMKDFEVKKIRRILYPKSSTSLSDSDSDCELISAPFGLFSTICPYTTMTFKHPMRRYVFDSVFIYVY